MTTPPLAVGHPRSRVWAAGTPLSCYRLTTHPWDAEGGSRRQRGPCFPEHLSPSPRSHPGTFRRLGGAGGASRGLAGRPSHLPLLPGLAGSLPTAWGYGQQESPSREWGTDPGAEETRVAPNRRTPPPPAHTTCLGDQGHFRSLEGGTGTHMPTHTQTRGPYHTQRGAARVPALTDQGEPERGGRLPGLPQGGPEDGPELCAPLPREGRDRRAWSGLGGGGGEDVSRTDRLRSPGVSPSALPLL